LLATV